MSDKPNSANGVSSYDSTSSGSLIHFFNRNITPYATESSGPKFDLVPVEKHKDIMINVARLHAKQEYDRIMEQVEVLKRQAESLEHRMRVSDMMYDINITFKPVHGKIYYVYLDTLKNKRWISMNHPDSWSALGIHHKFVIAVQLMGDSNWQEVEI
jgi:hypothetical protein